MNKTINLPKLGYRIEIEFGWDGNWRFLFGFNIWKPGILIGFMNFSGYIQLVGGSNE
jgi:hypothetical protein